MQLPTRELHHCLLLRRQAPDPNRLESVGSESGSVLEDDVEYELPLGGLAEPRHLVQEVQSVCMTLRGLEIHRKPQKPRHESHESQGSHLHAYTRCVDKAGMDAVQMLLKAGADPLVRNRDNQIPREVATRAQVVATLEEAEAPELHADITPVLKVLLSHNAARAQREPLMH